MHDRAHPGRTARRASVTARYASLLGSLPGSPMPIRDTIELTEAARLGPGSATRTTVSISDRVQRSWRRRLPCGLWPAGCPRRAPGPGRRARRRPTAEPRRPDCASGDTAPAMTFPLPAGLDGMTTPTARSTVTELALTMFAVSDQDAARTFYTDVLGFEVRGDDRYGENGEMRWLEVAPPGSRARLALNPPMRGEPGGGSIGVETTDMRAELERISAIEGVTITTPPMDMGGAPPMFSIADPDGNTVWIVETPAS